MNKLKKATVVKTGKQVEVYYLSGSSKHRGKWCDYSDMKSVYTTKELKFEKP